MKITVATLLERFSTSETALRPQDIGVAKRFIKSRLKLIYPRLRGNPVALEAAYQKLDLAMSEIETDTGVVIYELTTPDEGD